MVLLRTHCRTACLTLLIVLLACVCPSAQAKTAMDVAVGWEGVVQYGRWNPVLVTLSDPDNPSAVVEISAPHDGLHGIRIQQFVGTLEATPKTFVLYLPIYQFFSYGGSPVSITVRDAQTRKLLAATRDNDRAFQFVQNVDMHGSLLAVSGRRTTLNALRSLPHSALRTGFLEMEALPTSPMGYDAADVVVLNAADLNLLSDDQQQALVDWVRAGGKLLYWPGEAPVPASSALVDVLPCRIGPATLLKLTPEQLSAAGLPGRFASLPARELTPSSSAQPVHLLGSDTITAYRGQVGLGLILVSPIGLDDLQFTGEEPTRAAWRPVLEGMVVLRDPPPPNQPQVYRGEDPRQMMQTPPDQPQVYRGEDPRQMMQTQAENGVADMLGSVPGAGQFGFSYVVIVLIGLMVVVGPVDWFVLRMLGRQPWTWVTTTGWVALVTLGALYVGHVFKSGDLHLRTFSVVDQVGDSTVARSDYLGIYSPRSNTYIPEIPPASWWRPLAPEQQYYGGRALTEAAFRQTYRGNTPQPMFINVWSLRFLQGQTLATGPALIGADLRAVQTDVQGRLRVTGTLHNLSDRPLQNVRLMGKVGKSATSKVAVPAGGSVPIDMWIDPKPPENPQPHHYVYGQFRGSTEPLEVALSLSWMRMAEIERLLRDGTAICVLAEQKNPTPVATLAGETPVEKHWQVIRAVVPLKKWQPRQ